MKNILVLLISLQILKYDSQREIVRGHIYFKLIDASNCYKFNNESIEKINKSLDNIRRNPNARKQDKDIVLYYDKLKDANLLKSPSIKIIDDKEKITTVFLSEKEFAKLNKYSLDYLRTNHKKVALEISTKLIGDGLYYSDNIVSIKETEGETPIKK